MVGRWWSRIGGTGVYEKGGEGKEMDGAGGYCLTGIGIDRPRDAMERVAEGCWSMLRDVKSTPPTLTLPGYFFPRRPKRRERRVSREFNARVVHRLTLETYVNVRRTCGFLARGEMNNFLLDAEERRSCVGSDRS